MMCMGWRGGLDLGAHAALTEDQAWGVGMPKGVKGNLTTLVSQDPTLICSTTSYTNNHILKIKSFSIKIT